MSGVFLRCLTNHRHYKKLLMFLISLAIGTLNGTAFLHLIPQVFKLIYFLILHIYGNIFYCCPYILNTYFIHEKLWRKLLTYLNILKAFGLTEYYRYSVDSEYIWKALVILGGVYLFFLVEQIMRFLMQFRKVFLALHTYFIV